MTERSTKPYLIRAVHEWACDSGLTPYISVKVDAQTRVPAEHVRDGEIVLNLSPDATHRLTIGNELIQFAARFGGVSRECTIPLAAVQGVFARENGQGLYFPDESSAQPQTTTPIMATVVTGKDSVATDKPEPDPETPAPGGRPRLQVVK